MQTVRVVTPSIERIVAADAIHLLRASSLPVDDLATSAVTLFAHRSGGAIAAVVGLQRCGSFGLLRSLAVDPTFRSTGLGTTLCDHACLIAAGEGIATIYLLTTDAADFFAARGFTVVERADVPAPIRATSQFSSLCPSSAHVMVRQLQGATHAR